MPKPLPSLELLRVFESCARCQGFTAAGAELGMTQPAVSQQIQRLERELGTRLFDRVHRGIALTAAGQGLLAPVQQALNLLQDALVVARARPARSQLSVATDFAFASYWLMPRLAHFYQAHPDIDVSLVTCNRALQRLAPDTDLAIVFGDGRLPRAQSHLLFREEVFAVCSPSLLQLHGGDVAALLQAAPLLHLKPATGQRWFDWPGVSSHGGWPVRRPTEGPAFDHYTMVVGAAIAGQGVAIGWRYLVDDLLDQGLLFRLPLPALVSGHGYYLMTPRQKRLPASAGKLVDWLLGELPALQGAG